MAEWTVGIDVSEWQGQIDWPAVAASGVRWAICRTGDGRYTDPTFSRNVAGAKAAGLLVGAYHFVRDSLPVDSMAAIIAGHVHGIDLDFPVTLDYETFSGVPASPARWIAHLATTVEAATSRPPIIYTGYYHWQTLQGGSLLDYLPLWMPAYTRGYQPYAGPVASWPEQALAAPTWDAIPPAWRWSIWQFTSSAQVPGIAGSVDANLCTTVTLADLTGLDEQTTPDDSEDADMAVAIRINDPAWPQFTGTIFATDGVAKVPVPSVAVLEELIAAGAVRKQADGSLWRDVSMAAARVPMSCDEWAIAGMPARVVAAISESRPAALTQEVPQ